MQAPALQPAFFIPANRRLLTAKTAVSVAPNPAPPRLRSLSSVPRSRAAHAPRIGNPNRASPAETHATFAQAHHNHLRWFPARAQPHRFAKTHPHGRACSAQAQTPGCRTPPRPPASAPIRPPAKRPARFPPATPRSPKPHHAPRHAATTSARSHRTNRTRHRIKAMARHESD